MLNLAILSSLHLLYNYCFKEVIFDGFEEKSWEFFLEFLGRILGCALKCRIKAGTECVLSTERSKRRYLA